MEILQPPKDAPKYFLVTHYPSRGESYLTTGLFLPILKALYKWNH